MHQEIHECVYVKPNVNVCLTNPRETFRNIFRFSTHKRQIYTLLNCKYISRLNELIVDIILINMNNNQLF